MSAEWKRESLVRMLNAGYTITDIANRYKVSRQRALQVLQKEGLWRKRGHLPAMKHERDLPLRVSALGNKSSIDVRIKGGTQI